MHGTFEKAFRAEVQARWDAYASNMQMLLLMSEDDGISGDVLAKATALTNQSKKNFMDAYARWCRK